MEIIQLPANLEAINYQGVRISRDDMELVEVALAHAANEAHDLRQGSPGDIVIGHIVDDWCLDWKRRIQKAVPVTFHEAMDMLLLHNPDVLLTRNPDNARYELFCKQRHVDQLGIILHVGQEWADNASCMIYCATIIAFEKTGSPFLGAGDIDNPEVETAVAKIAHRFAEMRKALL